jgi:transcriptional regulator GlxA family with amidase domain
VHIVAVIALPGVVLFDLSIPCGIFGRAVGQGGRPAYEVRVCGPIRTVQTRPVELSVPWGLKAAKTADTIIVPGVEDVTLPVPEEVLTTLRAAARRGARVASICSGAFVLAEAGLLEGRCATTHWKAAPVLAKRYPNVAVDPNVLFVDAGKILTSAGAAAGFDLCLHMLRQDLGAAAAAEAARFAVMPLEREGGQAQFIIHPPPASSASLAPLLLWLQANLHRPIPVEEMARRARASVRTFSRRFRQQTGTTPVQWLLHARVRRAQALLETCDLPIELIATQAGFESGATFRDRFRRIVGVSPAAYRRAFGTAASPRRGLLPPASAAALGTTKRELRYAMVRKSPP